MTSASPAKWVAAGPHAALTFLLLIVALWLATRPYYGIVYDARYYVLLGLDRLHPAAFADDLLFRFGNFDRITIFPQLAAQAIALFGLSAGTMFLTILGQLLWVGGLTYCAVGFLRDLRDRSLALLSVVVVVALPAGYYRYGYGEPILTARLFAEAVTLLALGCFARGRLVRAFALLAVSLAIHPIMAGAGIGVVLIYLALQRRVWWWAVATGAGAVIAFAVAGIEPFAKLFSHFDPGWFAIVSGRTSDAVITAWSIQDFCWIVPTVVLAVIAAVIGPASDRRLFSAALVVGVGALVCSFVGSQSADVLIVQLMPARSLWLPTVLAHLYVVPMLFRLRAERAVDGLTIAAFASALGCLLVSRLIPPLILVAAPATTIAGTLVVRQHLTERPLGALGRVVCLFTAGATAAAIIFSAYKFVVVLLPVPDDLRQRLLSFAVVLVAVVLAAAQQQTTPGGRGAARRWLPVAAAALIPIALLEWDLRTPWERMIEAPEPALATLLPPRASVYWEGGVDLLWFAMRRASYFSCAQGGGALYSRDEAMAFRRRAKSFAQLHTMDFKESGCTSFAVENGPGRTREGLQLVCRQQPGLDILVLTTRIPGVDAKVLTLPAPHRSVRVLDGRIVVKETDRFFAYSCADMR